MAYASGTQSHAPKRRARRAAAAPRRAKPSWLRRHILGITFLLLAFLTIAGVAAAIAVVPYRGDSQWVYVPRGASEQQIADSLEARLGSSMAQRVMLLWRLQKGSPRMACGAYRIDPGQSALRISRNIARGQQTPVDLTFNSCRTLGQLADRVASQLDFTPAEFVEACSRQLPPLGYTSPEMYPAAFIPDKYQVYWSSDADAIVSRLADERNRFWTDERRRQAKAMGLTPVQVATIASIVEEETAKADEMPLVARLYLNRLDKGMKLQADPTVKFALGDFSLKRIRANHINQASASPYNTYTHQGLPPGPIRIVNRQTLLDVLQAPKHPYIYMCAKEDFSGYHNFAVDYADHQANARRYQAELNRRGIK